MKMCFFFMSGAEINLPDNLKGGVTKGVSICGPCSVEQEQPKPICALLPSSMEACHNTVYEVSQSITSISRSQESLKITTVRTEPDDGEDIKLLRVPS